MLYVSRGLLRDYIVPQAVALATLPSIEKVTNIADSELHLDIQSTPAYSSDCMDGGSEGFGLRVWCESAIDRQTAAVEEPDVTGLPARFAAKGWEKVTSDKPLGDQVVLNSYLVKTAYERRTGPVQCQVSYEARRPSTQSPNYMVAYRIVCSRVIHT